MPRGLRWQEPDGGWGEAAGRTDLHVTIDTAGRTADRRDDFAEVYGDWAEVGARIEPAARKPAAGRARRAGGPARLRAEVLAALRRAEQDPGGAVRRRGAGPARRRRRGARGARRAGRRAAPGRGRRRRHLRGRPQHQLHQRVLHRLPVLRVRPAAHRRRRLHAVARAGRRPGRGGLAGRGDRGVHAGRHPPGPARHRLLRPGRRGEAALPAASTCTRSRRWR